ADDGAAARPRPTQDSRGGHSLSPPARGPPAPPAAGRACVPVPNLTRGLRTAAPPRALRRGDPAREGARGADGRRARSVRAARADAAARRPPDGAPRRGGRARAARGPGSRALEP